MFICGSSTQGIKNTKKVLDKELPYLPKHYLLAEEELWPFKDESLDLVVTNLSLHQSNDLSTSFQRILKSLKPDGIMIGHAYGERTLQELKNVLMMAELERSGGIDAHAFQ